MNASILSAQNLSKVVGSARDELITPHDLSLNLACDDGLAIVGSSGSGEPTLLGLPVGFDQPSGGGVCLTGHALGDLDEDQWTCACAAHVGFVFQSSQLPDSLDTLENVMLPLGLEGRTGARQHARELLERVGFGQRLGHCPRQLSDDEQQRVITIRVFAAEPNVLFADKPIGNLDSATGGWISDLLFEPSHERGITLILVTYDERLAHRCRRLIRLESGHLIDRVGP